MTDAVIEQHLLGQETIGVYPLLPDKTCWFPAADFDKKTWEYDALAFLETCKEVNVPAVANGKLIVGFGLVAWPAQYGVTGIHTFMVDQDGIIYEKDIEPAPNGVMPATTRYDPDPSWGVVE